MLAYQLQRSPRGLLVLRGINRESVEKAWQQLMEKARINPYMVFPLVIEGDMQGNVVEWLDLRFRPDEVDFEAYRNELRRSITALYGVSPIFVSEGGGGRESMQVLVTNRAVEMEQRLFNDKILPWLTRQLGVADWKIMLKPNELRDEMTMLNIFEKKLQIAEKLKQLGHKYRIVSDELGNLDIEIIVGEPEANGDEGNGDSGGEEGGGGEVGDERERARKRYYQRHFEDQEFEGEPEVREERSSDQNYEGQSTAPQERLEGGVEGVE